MVLEVLEVVLEVLGVVLEVLEVTRVLSAKQGRPLYVEPLYGSSSTKDQKETKRRPEGPYLRRPYTRK